MPRARFSLAVLLALTLSSWAFAQERATHAQALADFLDEAWGPGLAARRALDEQGPRLAVQFPDDAQVEYARALALLSQNRVAEALPLLADLTDRDDAPLESFRMLAWAQAARGEYATALVTLEAYANRLAQPNDLNGHEMDDAIRFTGRMIGFLDGPASDAIGAATVDRHANAILALYDDRHTRLFNEAAQEVVANYLELIEGSQASREQAAEEEAERREQVRDQLAQQEANAAVRLNELDDQRAELLVAAEEAIAEIEADLLPLQNDYADLEAEARIPRRQMDSAIIEIQRLEARLPNMPDGPQRTSTIDRIHDLQYYYRRARDDLRLLSREGDRIEIQVAQLARRRADTQLRYQQELAILAEQVAELNDSVERIQGRQRRISGPGSADTGEARALAVRAGSLSTYDELPLAAYKADLLAELAEDAP